MKKKATIMDDGREVIRYENKGATPEQRRAIAKENGAKFARDAKAGKPCCISDLIGQAEQCHVDRIEERRTEAFSAPTITSTRADMEAHRANTKQ